MSAVCAQVKEADAKSSQPLQQRRRNGSAPLQEPLPLLVDTGPRGLTAADVLAEEGKSALNLS